MNFLVWLILVSSVHSSPQGRRRESNRSPSSRNRIKELSDEDILKALSILMSETEQDRPRSKSQRRGRQEFPSKDDFPPRQEVPAKKEFSDEFEFKPASEFDEEDLQDDGFVEADRQSFRGGGGGRGFSNLETCEVTGFETRTREECEEAFEVECRPIKVKKIRTEIIEKCETLLEKTCNVSYTGIPKQQCSPKKSKRCEIDYKVVEEKLYKEECKVNVQHICEEHIKVPIPYPVKEPYHEHHHPVKEPYHENHHPVKEPYQEKPDHHHPHETPEDIYIHTHENPIHNDPHSFKYDLPQPKEYYGPPAPLPAPPAAPPLAPLPSPLPALPYMNHPASLGGTLARHLFQRQKRTAEGQRYSSMDSVQGIVEQVLLEAIQRKEAIADGIQTKKEARKANPLDYPLRLPDFPHSSHSALTSGHAAVHIQPELVHSFHHHHHHDFPRSSQHPPPSLNAGSGLLDSFQSQNFHDFSRTGRQSSASRNPIQIPFPDLSKAGFQFPDPVEIPDFDIEELNSSFDDYDETDINSDDNLDSTITESNNQLSDELANPAHLLPPNLQQFNHPLNPDLSIGGELTNSPSLVYPDPHSQSHYHSLSPHHAVHHSFPDLLPGHPIPEHPPLVTTHEIPSQPGCRSLATKTCYKIPIIVPKKVPFETCREVPDVECVTVLKNVPEVNCTPEPYEECNDVAKDIPYLEPAEECEEIAYDDCVEVEERIPVELCKRKRVDEESIFLTRGQVFRKEGEKRRKKVGTRRPNQLNEKEKDAEENK